MGGWNFIALRIPPLFQSPLLLGDLKMNKCSRCGHRGHNKQNLKKCISYVDFVEKKIPPISERNKTWITVDGTEMLMREMTDNHLRNTINFCEKRYINITQRKINMIIKGMDSCTSTDSMAYFDLECKLDNLLNEKPESMLLKDAKPDTYKALLKEKDIRFWIELLSYNTERTTYGKNKSDVYRNGRKK